MWLCDRRRLIGLFTLTCCVLSSACAADLERYPAREPARGSLGEEVYKALCRRIAGTEYPEDVAGRRTETLCLGDARAVTEALAREAHAPRLLALAAQRTALVRALDDTFEGELSDPLERLLRRLTPFYEPPEERVQWATRELAGALERFAGKDGSPPDLAALAGLLGASRSGLAPVDLSFGIPRALLGASGLREVSATLLPLLAEDPEVAAQYEALAESAALELAEPRDDPARDADLAELKALLLRARPDFASGTPLLAGVRDARGLPLVRAGASESIPSPFVDRDADGRADADARGLLGRDGEARPPTPFPVPGDQSALRDPLGRALAPDGSGRLLYETVDLDATLLAGAARAARPLFDGEHFTHGLAAALGPLLGEQRTLHRRYGAFELAYRAPDPRASPLLDLVHAATALLDQPAMDDALALGERLLGDQEPALVEALEPLLALERRTRAGAGDAYPEARLEPEHDLWSDLLRELEKLSRRRREAGEDSLLEALVRSALGYARDLSAPGAPTRQIIDPELLRRQGAIVATLMRFKDEWRSNPGGSAARRAGQPAVIGGFRTPVDRSRPDAPVSCGRDGCGGVIEGTPLERFRKPGQNCVIQRAGRPLTGKDCGAPANQSLFHRSLGLLAEMAGRGQCNKRIRIDELLAATAEDPCVGAVRPESSECRLLRQEQASERRTTIHEAERALAAYTCPADQPGAACRAYAERYPAAFLDADGPSGAAPASIEPCHLLDLPDLGRAFGEVLNGTYELAIPNPWVRRFLEDIARAGDHDGDGAQDLPTCTREGGYANFPIVDPTLAPACVPEAAKLARDVYAGMPRSVDALPALIAFLLDQPELFAASPDPHALRPDPKALSHVLFAEPGGAAFVPFDPLLVRGAPPVCASAPALPACADDDTQPTPPGGCCIRDVARPPLRFRLDTYYGATTFAWEHPLRTRDGQTLSFFDMMKPLADAIARYDFVPGRDDPRAFEDTSYVLASLGRLLAEHYDSPANPAAQRDDPSAPNHRRLTGLSRYEAMFADALDDGTLDLAQAGPDGAPLFSPDLRYAPEQQLGFLYHAQPLLAALDEVELAGGRDGVDVSMDLLEQLINPHARCAGASGDRRVIDGQGACDRVLRGEPGLAPPLAYRSGRLWPCLPDGRCFDGEALPRRFASPARQLLDVYELVSAREHREPARRGAFRGLFAGVAASLLATDDGRLEPRARAITRFLLDHAREELAAERAAGTLPRLTARIEADVAELLGEPVVTAALGLLDALHDQPPALRGLAEYARSVLAEGPGEGSLRALVAGTYDALALSPATAETKALRRALAPSLLRDVEQRVREGHGSATARESAIGRNLYLVGVTAQRDDTDVLTRVSRNLTRPRSARDPSPLDVLLDVWLEVERVRPGAGEPADPRDLAAVLSRASSVIRDERRGFERIYELLRCTSHPDGEGCR